MLGQLKTKSFQTMPLKRAFSLVELMVVIAIVGILVAIIFPVVVGAKRRAKVSACLSNESQIGKAVLLYSNDNDDLFPYAVDATDKYASDIWNSHLDWKAQIPTMLLLNDALAGYAPSPELFHCPADTGYTVLDNDFPTELSAQPSSFKAFGLSYVYRTEVAFKHLSQSDLQSPTEFNLIADGSGHWHSGAAPLTANDDPYNVIAKLRQYRYVTVFGDLHAKSISRAAMDRAWQVAP
jgi:general secretion pathway protein G